MKTIAVVGATGYLGGFVCQSLREQGYQVRYLVRNEKTILEQGVAPQLITVVDVTSRFSLRDQLNGIDCVISCLGITRQKDGLSYMDIDYQANANVLDEALNAGVKQFIYVSVFRGDEFRHVALCAAKERFVDHLRESGMAHCVVRPTGFFSDLADFWHMAKSGRVWLFGDGQKRVNPIHGKDLADAIVNLVSRDHSKIINAELNIGGPQTFTQADIARMAFKSQLKPNRTTFIPDQIRRVLLSFGKRLLSEASFGPIEFFLTILAHDMVAPAYGHRTLKAHFAQLNDAVKPDVLNESDGQQIRGRPNNCVNGK